MPRGVVGRLLLGDERELDVAPVRVLPERSSFATELLPLAGPNDRLPAGVGMVLAREECMSIGVTNYGSVDVFVNSGEPTDGALLIGPGAAMVPPGGFAMLTLPGHVHTFYGRPNELVGVTRFPKLQSGTVAQISPGLWHPVDLGVVGASALAYTTPWGNPATYGGFTARETVGTSPVAFQVRDGTATGTLLADVNLGAGGSTEEDTTMSACATDSLFVVFIGGGGTLRLTLRVR